MNTKGTVNQIQANGTYEHKDYGTFYQYELSIQTDNGAKNGQYSSKKYQSIEGLPFAMGEEIYFEYIDGQYPKIKNPTKENPENRQNNQSNYAKKPQSNNASFALSYAKDVYCACTEIKSDPAGDIIEIADKFLEWLNKN